MSKIKDTASKVMARIVYDTKYKGINLARRKYVSAVVGRGVTSTQGGCS